MNRKVHISLLFCALGILTVQAQWTKQDSIRLKRLLEGEGEVKVNTEAVNAIRFDFTPEAHKPMGKPLMSQKKAWMEFNKDLPQSYENPAPEEKPKEYIRLTPYTAFTKWNETPLSKATKDSLAHLKIALKLNHLKPDPSKMNGHRDVPAGMDPTITPSNSPAIGGLDIDKFLYEIFSKKGRMKRRNRKRAKAWKHY